MNITDLNRRILSFLRGCTLMKRFGGLLALVLLGSMISGCDSGLKEGSPSEPFTSSQTPEFKNLMKKAAGKMMRKGGPKPSGNGATAKGS
jgi:hypothetical protein